MKITPQKYAKTLAFTFGVCRFVGRHFDTRLGQLIEMSMDSISPRLFTSSAKSLYGLIDSSENSGIYGAKMDISCSCEQVISLSVNNHTGIAHSGSHMNPRYIQISTNLFAIYGSSSHLALFEAKLLAMPFQGFCILLHQHKGLALER